MPLSPQPSPRGSRLSRWLTSPRGQLLLHRSYSWGAALVILGALFKILELPYADHLLLVSMLTECLIFILSGFDSPKEEAATGSEAGTTASPQASRQLHESIEALRLSVEQLSQQLASSPSLHTSRPEGEGLGSSLSCSTLTRSASRLSCSWRLAWGDAVVSVSVLVAASSLGLSKPERMKMRHSVSMLTISS